MKRPPKATDRVINQAFLDHRTAYSKSLGYSKQKWVEFCETMISKGFEVRLYEAKHTVSKYVTVTDTKRDLSFKIRFSNHKPNETKEIGGDCDFFVGRTNLGVSTTVQAIEATLSFFEERVEA